MKGFCFERMERFGRSSHVMIETGPKEPVMQDLTLGVNQDFSKPVQISYTVTKGCVICNMAGKFDQDGNVLERYNSANF